MACVALAPSGAWRRLCLTTVGNRGLGAAEPCSGSDLVPSLRLRPYIVPSQRFAGRYGSGPPVDEEGEVIGRGPLVLNRIGG